ncbi:MAG: SpoIIE family protein phosphatase [Armatimonadota bacterium]
MNARLGFRSITGKLLAAFLLVFLLLAALQFAIRHEYSRSYHELASDSMLTQAKAAQARVESVLDNSSACLKLTLSTLGKNEKPERIKQKLQLLVNSNHNFIAAGLMDEKGHLICRYPALPPGGKLATLPPAILRSVPCVSSVSRLGGQPVFTITIPDPTADSRLNIFYVVISVDTVTCALHDYADESRCVAVLDRDGSIVSETGGCIDHKSIHGILFSPKLAEGQFHQFDEPDICGWGTICERSGWRIAVLEHPKVNDTSTAGVYIVLLQILTMALALLIFLTIGNRIASPIRKLSRAAAAVAVGDLRRRVKINTNDELHSLAVNFNKMADSLESQQKALRLTTRVQQSLLDVTKTVSASLDVKIVASSIEDILKSQFGAEHVIIYRVSDESCEIEPVLIPEPVDDAFRAAMLALARHALDSLGDIPAPGAAAYSCPKAGELPAVTVPLVVGSRPVGALITTFPGEDYSKMQLEDRISFLGSFASCAAIAIHNACTHGRTEELIDTLDSLRRVDESISASLDLRQILCALVRTTEDVMWAEACAILLVDSSGRLTVAESSNLNRKQQKKLETELQDRKKCSILVEICRDAHSEPPGKTPEDEGDVARIYAPLTAGESVVGAVVVWKKLAEKSEQREIDLLSAIANHAAVVIANAKMFSREYRIAETLQSMLVGVIPNKLGGLILGNKYLSALDESRVGGDLFDAIALPNGKTALLIADVSGKGIQAAVHTAMVRYMARAFIFQWQESPATALDMLNRAIVNYFGSVAIVTVFCAVIDPATGSIIYANAGHPPAIVLKHSGKQQTMLYRTGIPVGYTEDSRYEEREAVLAPGDLLLLYTDGIIEARREGRVLSTEGLQDILFRHAELGPEKMVEIICEETRNFAEGNIRDDIAIIAAALENKPVAVMQWEIDYQQIH